MGRSLSACLLALCATAALVQAEDYTYITNNGTIMGTGTIVNNFSNGGILAPGLSPGILNITGNFTNTATFNVELGESRLSVQDFLKSRHPAWNLVGRVHFNLAENRRSRMASDMVDTPWK